MDDSEFVRSIAAEFKRRGYTVAIQLKIIPQPKSETDVDAGNAKIEAQAVTKSPQKGGKASEVVESGESAAVRSSEKPKAASVPPTNAEREDQESPIPLPSFPFHPSTINLSQKNSDSWNAMFAKLRTYHGQNNGALPLHAHPNSDKAALCKWTKTQLTLWRRMKKDGRHNLSLERIIKLHSLDLERGAQLHHDIQSSVLLMRPANEGGDCDEAKQMMMGVGRHARKWQDKFEDLKRYKMLHGDTNVPRNYNVSLSKWCSTQRLRCKAVMSGDTKTAMSETQFQALESIGFEMRRQRKYYNRSVLDKKWEANYNELLQYKEKYGNTDVAVRKGFEEYKQLANWAGLQRQKYKAKQTGKKAGRTTEITDEQIKMLASIGFSFSLQDDFDTRFKHLLEYKKEFGHTKVPVFYTGYNNLGRWAKRMRDGIRNNEPWVDDVRKTRLLGIDFDIAARHVFGHKPKKKSDDTVKDDDVMDGVEDEMEPVEVEAHAVAAATAMARMDNNPFGNMGGPQFFYHGYSNAPP